MPSQHMLASTATAHATIKEALDAILERGDVEAYLTLSAAYHNARTAGMNAEATYLLLDLLSKVLALMRLEQLVMQLMAGNTLMVLAGRDQLEQLLGAAEQAKKLMDSGPNTYM